MSNKIIQSYVFKDNQAWFVSTIERNYDTYEGSVRGPETMVWEWDPDTRKRGDSIVYQGEDGIDGHLRVCRSLHEHGVANAEAKTSEMDEQDMDEYHKHVTAIRYMMKCAIAEIERKMSNHELCKPEMKRAKQTLKDCVTAQEWFEKSYGDNKGDRR
ncbi:MAG: hypothetical protein EOM12_03515 [Verrucomicrobiae bacterium]|nr:hypothetical protein [Verrucomicrobiae bacterium]